MNLKRDALIILVATAAIVGYMMMKDGGRNQVTIPNGPDGNPMMPAMAPIGEQPAAMHMDNQPKPESHSTNAALPVAPVTNEAPAHVVATEVVPAATEIPATAPVEAPAAASAVHETVPATTAPVEAPLVTPEAHEIVPATTVPAAEPTEAPKP